MNDVKHPNIVETPGLALLLRVIAFIIALVAGTVFISTLLVFFNVLMDGGL